MERQYWIYALGFLAQGFFGARLIIQWIMSERQGKVVSPSVFWYLSVLASFLFLIYGILQDDVVIIFGQTISYYIYIRNMQLKKDWQKLSLIVQINLLALPFLAISWAVWISDQSLNEFFSKNDLSHPLLILGAIGQLMLNFRFVYQWYYSEKHKTSLLPIGFWIISSLGSVFIIFYSLYRYDPVLLVAQSMGMVPYVRNMIIHYKNPEA